MDGRSPAPTEHFPSCIDTPLCSMRQLPTTYIETWFVHLRELDTETTVRNEDESPNNGAFIQLTSVSILSSDEF